MTCELSLIVSAQDFGYIPTLQLGDSLIGLHAAHRENSNVG
jgi:hypothetical protein